MLALSRLLVPMVVLRLFLSCEVLLFSLLSLLYMADEDFELDRWRWRLSVLRPDATDDRFEWWPFLAESFSLILSISLMDLERERRRRRTLLSLSLPREEEYF